MAQGFNLRLLFFESVHKEHAQAVIADAFDIAMIISKREEWCDLLDVLGSEADVFRAVLFPGERDRAQPINDVQATLLPPAACPKKELSWP